MMWSVSVPYQSRLWLESHARPLFHSATTPCTPTIFHLVLGCVLLKWASRGPPSSGESSGPSSKLNGSPAVVCQTILAFVHYEASQKISRSCHDLPRSFLSLSRSGLVERPRPSMWKPSPWLLGRMGRWLWPTHTPLPPLSVLQRKSICQSL